MKRLFILLLFILFGNNFAGAQSSAGTEFWLAYMENLTLAFNGPPSFSIHISADSDATGTISVPATGYTQDYSLAGGQQIEVTLPAAIWYSEDTEVIEGKGIRILSDTPVEVSATHFRAFFTEATAVLPLAELSDEYLTTCLFGEEALFPSEFVVVATTDNTEIEIIPSAFTAGLHPADVPFTITMDEGEIYQVQALADLTASRVRSINGEKIAVFSGSQQARITESCDGFADNHLWEQSQPFSNWSDLYYFVPFKNQGGDLVRILAKEDNTTIYFDCNETTILQTGEYYDTVLANPTVISSTTDIAVTQFNQSLDCSPVNLGDPSMLRLYPTNRQTLNVRWQATDGESAGELIDISNHFVNIVMKTEDVVAITLDGNDISTDFSAFPGDATLSYTQIETTAGDHEIDSNQPFQAYFYGLGDYDAYTKMGSYALIADLPYVCLEIEADGIFCVDSTLNFIATSNFAIASYDWQTSDNQSSSLASPNFVFTSEGEFTVSLTITTNAGDIFTDELTLNILDCSENPCEEDIVLSIEPVGNCISEPVTFTYDSTVEFVSVSWNFGVDNTISNEEMPTYIYTEPGTYDIIFVGFDDFNCSYSQTLEYAIEDCEGCGEPILDITPAGDLCIGEPIILNSTYVSNNSDTEFFNWMSSDGQTSDLPNPTFTFASTGIFQVSLTIFDLSNDCFYEGNIDIEIEDCSLPCTNLPSVNLSGDLYQCLGESYLISLETEAELVNYQWFLNGELSTTNVDDFFISNPTTLGIFTLELLATDADDCIYEALFEWEVGNCNDPCVNYTVGDILVDGELCIDTLITISTSIPDPSASYSWSLNTGETFNTPTFTTTFSEETTITVSLTVLSEEDCIDEANFVFSIDNCGSLDDCLFPPESVQILAVTDLILCVGDSVQLEFFSEIVNIVSVNWQISDGRTFTEFSPQLIGLDANPLEVSLVAVDENDCIYEDTVFINYFGECEDDCEIFVPNVFTPNGDNANDEFKPLSDCTPDSYNLKIFSRWGELLFETNDFSESWDGNFRGKTCPASVYVWLMNFGFTNGNADSTTGDVTLIR